MMYMTKSKHEREIPGAKDMEIIHVSISFPVKAKIAEDDATPLLYLKERRITQIAYVRDLKPDELAKIMIFVKQVEGKFSTKKELFEKYLEPQFKEITGRSPSPRTLFKYVRNFQITINALGLWDKKGMLTIEGEKLARFYSKDKEKYKDYLGWLVLSRGGWSRIVSELDNIYKGGQKIKSNQHLCSILSKKLRKEGYIKGIWNFYDNIKWLIYLGILGKWDKKTKKYPIYWERIRFLLRYQGI